MSEEQRPLAKQPLITSEESRELTDKIHRLVRSFSRQLVKLVSEEIGARAIKVKNKPGPLPGFKYPTRKCPICRINVNSRRRFGFICKDCSAGKPIGFRTKMKEVFPQHKRVKKDKAGKDFEVIAPVKQPPEVLHPREVDIEDAEPDFLDLMLPAVHPTTPPERHAPVKSSDDEDFFT